MAPRPAIAGRTVHLVDETFDEGDKFPQKWPFTYPMSKNIPIEERRVLRRRPGLWKEIKNVNGLMVMAIGH
jgi:hypothetical protein